uniref:Uncharacterized protein n=2 Tax=Spongospora subterranea TaxID=70186 RepID=A0A0H5QX30_9EUKA|eukprot:CRZ06171.1 hypothetical protein [Spongospora subterranea]
MVLFRSSLGMVLCLCGSVLAVIPYADKTPWICVTIGTILAIFGCVGLMSLALRNNNHLRSTKMLTILLPIAAAFFCLPAANLEYPFVMICSGVTLIIAGVIAGAMVYSNSSRQCLEALEDLRIVIDQLNSRYQNKLQWTLIERLEEPRGKMDRTIEVLLEDISQMGNAGKKQHYQPAHVQVTIENNNAAPSPGKNDRTPYESQSQT